MEDFEDPIATATTSRGRGSRGRISRGRGREGRSRGRGRTSMPIELKAGRGPRRLPQMQWTERVCSSEPEKEMQKAKFSKHCDNLKAP